MRKFIDIITESQTDYRGEHGAADAESGAAMYDLTHNGIYPMDVYSSSGFREYASETPDGYQSAMFYRGYPNRPVTIYRSVPKDLVRPKIAPGDWVTTSMKYAREHGRDNLRNNYKIIKKSVYARDLYTDGDSLDEWGYDPQPFFNSAADDAVKAKFGKKTAAQRAEAYREKMATKDGEQSPT